MYNIMHSDEWPIIYYPTDPNDICFLSELNFQPTVRPPTPRPVPHTHSLPPPPLRLPLGPGSGPFRRPVRRKRVSILPVSGRY